MLLHAFVVSNTVTPEWRLTPGLFGDVGSGAARGSARGVTAGGRRGSLIGGSDLPGSSGPPATPADVPPQCTGLPPRCPHDSLLRGGGGGTLWVARWSPFDLRVHLCARELRRCNRSLEEGHSPAPGTLHSEWRRWVPQPVLTVATVKQADTSGVDVSSHGLGLLRTGARPLFTPHPLASAGVPMGRALTPLLAGGSSVEADPRVRGSRHEECPLSGDRW